MIVFSVINDIYFVTFYDILYTLLYIVNVYWCEMEYVWHSVFNRVKLKLTEGVWVQMI